MATSGTTAFDLNIDEIIDEGYERCGLSTNSGYDLRSARRSLNLLFAEWGNRGIHLWKVTLNTIALVEGQAEYSTAANTNDVLEAFVSTSANNTGTREDVSLTKIDRSAYAALPNKGSKGQPSQYYVKRETLPKIFLYITPDLIGDNQPLLQDEITLTFSGSTRGAKITDIRTLKGGQEYLFRIDIIF